MCVHVVVLCACMLLCLCMCCVCMLLLCVFYAKGHKRGSQPAPYMNIVVLVCCCNCCLLLLSFSLLPLLIESRYLIYNSPFTGANSLSCSHKHQLTVHACTIQYLSVHSKHTHCHVPVHVICV